MSALISSEQQHQQCLHILRQITDRIDSELLSVRNWGLCGGVAGLILFLVEMEANYPNTLGMDKIESLIDALQSNCDLKTLPPRLDMGLLGIAWLREHLQQRFGDDDDVNADIDQLILNALSVDTWSGEYELLAGLAGFGLYASKRSGYDSGKRMIEKVVQHLQSLMVETPQGLAWPSAPTSAYHSDGNSEQVEFNLGLAHGNASVLGCLTHIYRCQPTLEHERLLRGSADWLLAQRNPADTGSYFSYNNRRVMRSRIGWCYGDIGNALVLWRAGKALEDQRIQNAAKDIAVACTTRRDFKLTSCYDAGICHGSAGNMLIFQTLHDEMQHPALLDYAQFWLQQTFDYAQKEPNLDGLRRFDGEADEYQDCPGMLEGLAGVGLCLLAAVGHDSSWKESLLLE
ncbi:lanthionine synthetase LanC family protein [Bowmanella denitrificans]|uniref:lanthionine synthetase LanC family protein n=1 Tax=Bowmanella denitrificans TaxID=366582 RepID=UPI0011AF89F2|nr:lanthionine synthetase LanC family protein [Bowmanella denitrificans]